MAWDVRKERCHEIGQRDRDEVSREPGEVYNGMMRKRRFRESKLVLIDGVCSRNRKFRPRRNND